MYNTFISVVAVLDADDRLNTKLVKNLTGTLKPNFKDHEIILVNNGLKKDYFKLLKDLDGKFESQIVILNLSKPIDIDNAIVAGLDHSNGDYTVMLPAELADDTRLIVDLFEKTQENYDIVYAKAREVKISWFKKLCYRVFYYLIRRYSDLDLDFYVVDFRIISRRALNAILLMREKMRFMKGLCGFVGYRSGNIPYPKPHIKRPEPFIALFSRAFLALSSFTNMLNRLLFAIFAMSLIFSVLATLDIMRVKFYGVDLLGTPQTYIMGYAFLTTTTTVMFTLNLLILFIMSLYLSNIQQETKARPLYFLESVQKL